MNMNRKLPISNTDSNNIKTSKFATKIGQNKKKKRINRSCNSKFRVTIPEQRPKL
jgi:hypothetical protein